ncbi:MAG: diphthine--ammonia ligase [Nanoarchaeota archaeon]|nr:diphthine--ammonia ligase [Nanoarchaeota archaeon]
MKVGVLFSGGKDSTYAAFIAKRLGHRLGCLISLISRNDESYMFHTPSIGKVKKQAEVMELPLIIHKTEGRKEEELEDLEDAIKKAIEKYHIKGVVTGALRSEYQKSRIGKICNKLGVKAINPLWKRNQVGLLWDLIKHRFEVIIVGVAAYPLDKKWLGRRISKDFIEDVQKLQDKYGINPAGEGGEFETFVLKCPLFKRQLKLVGKKIKGSGHSWSMDIQVREYGR